MTKKFFKKLHYGEKGFTLIELLVVIAIIAVLAAIIVPNIGEYIGRGETAADQSEMALVKNAVAAAMSGAAVSSITGETVGPGDDLTITGPGGTFTVSQYFDNDDLSSLQHTYDVSAEGSVSLH